MRIERHPGVWHSGGLECDGVGCWEVWAETVTEGGWRSMAAWRREETDAARYLQQTREATVLGKWVLRTEAYRNLRSDTLWPSRRIERILVRTRDGARSA